MKDEYETFLVAKSGECSAREKIAALEAQQRQLRAQIEVLAIKNDALQPDRDYWQDLSVELRTQRDRWKARAEALERAANGYCVMCAKAAPVTICGKEIGAVTCEKMRERGVLCGGGRTVCEHWQFDEALFTAIAPDTEEM